MDTEKAKENDLDRRNSPDTESRGMTDKKECPENIRHGDGIGFDAGINPENWTASFTLRYGKILSTVTRDNVEIELNGNASADSAAGVEKTSATKVGTDGNLKIKIGRQINGAAVDLVKAGADADKMVGALSE